MGAEKDNVSRRSVSSRGSKNGEVVAMERGAWGGKLEFILTCIGYAVGLGNVWRFPYLLYRSGGGAFLIPFVIMLVIIGIPLFFLELNFGQFASLGPLTIWNISPIMKGLGFAMVFTNLCVALYYNVIISWCLYYLFASMTDVLPWVDCDNYWNTDECRTTAQFANMTAMNESTEGLKTPSEEYYYNKVLQMSNDIGDSGTVIWQLALCLLLCWFIIFFVLIRGISSLGKVVYVTSLFPYVLLTIMLIRGVTLEGAIKGIEFYLIPDWDRLLDPKVWSDAATQIFYALSTCTGGLIAMASYNDFHNNTLRDSLIVPIVNVLTSFYAGFVIFSVLGYMAHIKNTDVDKVAADGPGLVFVVYPEGLATMPVAPLWSILFFIMMMMLGLSSMFSMVECFFSGFMDEYPGFLRKTYWHTVIFRAVGCVVFYLISLPMITNGGFYVFTLFDTYTGNFPLLIVGLLELITLCYIYGYKNYADDVKMMLGKKPNVIFAACWLVISPLAVLAIIIFTAIYYKPPTLFSGIYVFPSWAEGIGWGIVAFCLFMIPVMFVYVMCKGGTDKIIYKTSQPNPLWGPASSENRVGRYAPPSHRRDSDASSSLDMNGNAWKTDGHTELQTVQPQSAHDHDGFDNKGFDGDHHGVDSHGHDSHGHHGVDSHGHDSHGFDSHGHDSHGHHGVDSHGHDSHGHDSHGHDSHGHDSHGHDSHGHHGHDSHGHDSHGHHGHDSHGHHRSRSPSIDLERFETASF